MIGLNKKGFVFRVSALILTCVFLLSCTDDSATNTDTGDAAVTTVEADRFKTTITSNKRFAVANGTDSALITVQTKDSLNNDKTKGGDAVVLATTLGNLSAVSDNGNGTYTATLTGTAQPDLAVITGTLNGKIINTYAGVAMRVDKTNADFISLAALGKKIFEDTNLSNPIGQSCASCHDALTGFDDPDDGVATSQGATVAVVFGQRNAQTVQYAAFTPQKQTINTALPELIGGQFWDGRAATLEIQTGQPFLNPLEMNNADKASVISKINGAVYKAEFESVFGVGTLNTVDTAYANMEKAIAAFLRTDEISPFSSKFDAVQKGTETYTEAEARGEAIFNNRAQCSTCHLTPDALGEQMFTNFEYMNIGVPENPANLFLNTDPNYIDLGLAEDTGVARDRGKFKVPGLRNIAKTAPYMHNGVFTTLRELIDFYNGDFGGGPEVNENLERGNQYTGFGLTPTDKNDLEAFLNALSDR